MKPWIKLKHYFLCSVFFTVGLTTLSRADVDNHIVEKKIRETAKSTVTTVKPFGFDALFDMQEENSSGHAHAGVYKETSSQQKGPFYPETYPDDTDADLTRVKDGQEALGVQIYVKGTVFDLNGKPLENALIEIWQACQSGKYDHPRDDNPAIRDLNFQYYAKTTTGADGSYSFKTIVPGPYPAHSNWMRPPHIHFFVQRASHKPLITQLYFAGESFPGTIAIIRGAEINGEVIDHLNALDRVIGSSSERAKKELITKFYSTTNKNGEPIKTGYFNIYLKAEE